MKTFQSQLAFNHLFCEKMTPALTHLWTPAKGAGLKLTALLLEPVKHRCLPECKWTWDSSGDLCISVFHFPPSFPEAPPAGLELFIRVTTGAEPFLRSPASREEPPPHRRMQVIKVTFCSLQGSN